MFCDLRGFTAFAETAEPGRRHDGCCANTTPAIGGIINKHEGTLERFAGDGLMVLFNDPCRARTLRARP